MVVLPAPLGPTSATSVPGSTVKDTPRSTGPLPRRSPVAMLSSEASETSSAEGYENDTSSTSTRTGPGRHGAGVGGLGDQRLQVEHLEDPLERHERGEDVDAHVGDRGERAVEPGQQRGEGEQGADRQGVVDGHHTAHAVDHGGRERRDEGERDEEHRAVDRDAHADVAHLGGADGVLLVLDGGAAEQLDEQGAGDVEALGHAGADLGVLHHLLVRQAGQLAPHQPGGDEEERDEREGAQGEGPGQQRHRDDDEHERDGVADDAGQHRRERLLRADDVVAEPGHEGTGLRTGEEGDGLAQDVGEHLRAQVVDQALTDAGGEPALDEGQPRPEDRDERHEEGQPHDDRGVLGVDAVVDEGLQQERASPRRAATPPRPARGTRRSAPCTAARTPSPAWWCPGPGVAP